MDGLKQLLQRYVRTLPVFDFNSEKYDLNLSSHIYSVSQISAQRNDKCMIFFQESKVLKLRSPTSIIIFFINNAMKTGSRSWLMDTDSLFLALTEEKLSDEKETHWKQIFRRKDFKADATKNFSCALGCAVHKKKHNKRQPGLIQEDFGCTDNLCL